MVVLDVITNIRNRYYYQCRIVCVQPGTMIFHENNAFSLPAGPLYCNIMIIDNNLYKFILLSINTAPNIIVMSSLSYSFPLVH